MHHAQLKLLKVRISFDDFGAAYASLSRLLDLSCIELKLDRSYVARCSSDPLKHAVCQTMVDLAHRVGSLACAKGVEHPEDLRCLIEMGCDSVQGFLFAKPMPPEAFVAQMISLGANFNEHFADDTSAAVRASHNP
jgi:EAL domain-containing protein (putative c-di-GMP-specific phosphodiesterase class I)